MAEEFKEQESKKAGKQERNKVFRPQETADLGDLEEMSWDNKTNYAAVVGSI